MPIEIKSTEKIMRSESDDESDDESDEEEWLQNGTIPPQYYGHYTTVDSNDDYFDSEEELWL